MALSSCLVSRDPVYIWQWFIDKASGWHAFGCLSKLWLSQTFTSKCSLLWFPQLQEPWPMLFAYTLFQGPGKRPLGASPWWGGVPLTPKVSTPTPGRLSAQCQAATPMYVYKIIRRAEQVVLGERTSEMSFQKGWLSSCAVISHWMKQIKEQDNLGWLCFWNLYLLMGEKSGMELGDRSAGLILT